MKKMTGKTKALQNFDDLLWSLEMDAKVMSGCLNSHRSMVFKTADKLRSFAFKFIPAYQRILRENSRLKGNHARKRDKIKCQGLD